MQILITGAAGNMGSLLARHLLASPHRLRLLVHRTPLPFDASVHPNASVCRADLGDPATLAEPCRDVDCIVHFAGILFAPRPEKFLPRTNVGYVENLLAAARAAGVRKFVLVSFPHVEGKSSPERPATGRMNGTPAPCTRARGSWRRSACSRPVTGRPWCPSSCASAPFTPAASRWSRRRAGSSATACSPCGGGRRGSTCSRS